MRSCKKLLRSDDTALQAELNSCFDEWEDIVTELCKVVTISIVIGFECMYAYKNGKTIFECSDSIAAVAMGCYPGQAHPPQPPADGWGDPTSVTAVQ